MTSECKKYRQFTLLKPKLGNNSAENDKALGRHV